MTRDVRRTKSREPWFSPASRLCEATLDVSFLNLAATENGRDLPDANIDKLCEGILASLKRPYEDRRK